MNKNTKILFICLIQLIFCIQFVKADNEQQLVLISKIDNDYSYSNSLNVIESSANSSELLYMRNASIIADFNDNLVTEFKNYSVNLNIVNRSDSENNTTINSRIIQTSNSHADSNISFSLENNAFNQNELYNNQLYDFEGSISMNEIYQFAETDIVDFLNHKNVLKIRLDNSNEYVRNRWNSHKNLSFYYYCVETSKIQFGYGSVVNFKIEFQYFDSALDLMRIYLSDANGGYIKYYDLPKSTFHHYAYFSNLTHSWCVIDDKYASNIVVNQIDWLTTFFEIRFSQTSSNIPEITYLDSVLYTENDNTEYLYSNFRTTNDFVFDCIFSVENAEDFEVEPYQIFPIFTFSLLQKHSFYNQNLKRFLFNWSFGISKSEQSEDVWAMAINDITLNSFPMNSRNEQIHIYFRFYNNTYIDFALKTESFIEKSTVTTNSEIAPLLNYLSSQDISYCDELVINTINPDYISYPNLKHNLYSIDSSYNIEKYKGFSISNRTTFSFKQKPYFIFMENWNTTIKSMQFINYNYNNAYFASAEPNTVVIGPCTDSIRYFNVHDSIAMSVSESNSFFNSYPGFNRQIQKALIFSTSTQGVYEYDLNVQNKSSFIVSASAKIEPKWRLQYTLDGAYTISSYSVISGNKIYFYVLMPLMYVFECNYNAFSDSYVFSLHYSKDSNKCFITIQYANEIMKKNYDYSFPSEFERLSIRIINYYSYEDYSTQPFVFFGLMFYPYMHYYENNTDFINYPITYKFGYGSSKMTLFTIEHGTTELKTLNKPNTVPILNYKIIYSRLYKIEYQIYPNLITNNDIQKNLCPSTDISFLYEYRSQNLSGYFDINTNISFNYTYQYAYGVIGFGSIDDSILSICNLVITSYWICVIEYFENNFDSAIKLLFPIFIFFLFPIVFYKSMKKVGLVLGFGLSILILIISNEISITSGIFIAILALIASIIIIKQKSRSEQIEYN